MCSKGMDIPKRENIQGEQNISTLIIFLHFVFG